MRAPRIAVLAFFLAACLFLLCRAITSTATHSGHSAASPPTVRKSGLRSFLSFSTPFSLFPPNAIISIADDNSTSFAARPAAFGPPLPNRGLDGQLWIGSGFTEETFQDGEGEGELGCSDVPGWDGNSNTVLKPAAKDAVDKFKSKSGAVAASSAKNLRRTSDKNTAAVPDSHTTAKGRPRDDGTDDYLHQGLDPSQKSQIDSASRSSSGHADIQSLQEGAEIAGKIVLLSRGGCGFLEKVKWAQRRGAVALIVGDNQRGGPLIQMFARGDTSNVTIPSIFTSRTTAYLLSLMMQPGTFVEGIIDENGKPALNMQQPDKTRKHKKARQQPSSAPAPLKSTSPKSTKASAGSKDASTDAAPNARGWLMRILGLGFGATATPDKARQPTTSQSDWILVEDFSDERDNTIKSSLENSKPKSNPSKPASDSFQIGVEDWRDPDLLGSTEQREKDGKENGRKKQEANGAKFGGKSAASGSSTKSKVKETFDLVNEKSEISQDETNSLFSILFGKHRGLQSSSSQAEVSSKPIDTPIEKPAPGEGTPNGGQEGLWVVITPSSSASPFFDTLLVLVISPLITLTVVYALLILRARIRRRRWRAPKSVVERLPVRTYHTVATTPGPSSRLPSPSSSSPTTPLLQNANNAQNAQNAQGPQRSRPRSRTTTGVPSAGEHLRIDTDVGVSQVPASRGEHEKRNSEWKKYMGRQVECVVCLEEYVDGVSQVMSLPCGHEFHVDCITPWLTTRRRTCPICKGDVVRSLARGSPSSPRYEPYQDDSDNEASPRASSSRPGLDADGESDIEQGVVSATEQPEEEDHQSSWIGMLSHSLGLGSSPRSNTEEPEQGR